MDAHRLAEERSLELHRRIAARLHDDPLLLDRARQNLERFASLGMHPSYVERWRSILGRPAAEVAQAIVERSERGDALRQTTPFTGIISPRERWLIWRVVRARRTA